MKVCPNCNINHKKQYTFCCHECSIEFRISKNIAEYNANPKLCKECNSKIDYKNRNNLYCSKKCNNLNKNKNRVQTQETKDKIANAIRNIKKTKRITSSHTANSILHWNDCIVCNKLFLYKRKKKTCSDDCLLIKSRELLCGMAQKAGKASASKRVKRSKKEIELYELLCTKFTCDHNKPIFNGWDADIIIPELKLAVLWNGNWHYKEMFGNHSLKQVQNRDSIKLAEITKMGWKHISIKDADNRMSSKKAFDEILLLLATNSVNCTVY